MAVTTLNATTNHGYIRSQSSTYSNARAGSGTKNAFATAAHLAGQQNISSTHYHYEAFLEFDTSSITGTITSVVLKIYVNSFVADNAFTLQARLYDFSTSLTTADWVPGADTSGDTLLATLASGSLSAGSYNSFTDVAFPANINTSGKTRFYVTTNNFVSATPPGGGNEEFCWWLSATESNPPQLVITTSDSTNGEVDKTIAAFTLSSTATRKTNGALSQEFGTIGLSAEGSVGGAGEGVLNQSIGTFALSGTIARKTNAYFENSIGTFGLGATTAVAIEGVLSASIGTFGLNAYSVPEIEAVLSQSIGAFGLDATSTGANQGVLSSSIGTFLLVAVESGPAWPSLYDFPQAPLDGTWRRERGDDTLRSDRTVGARQYRAQNGGNYADATFAIMVKSKNALDLLDRFYRDDCKNGATPFYWIDPETGDNMAWLWAAPPQIRHVARETYRVECALLKEAA